MAFTSPKVKVGIGRIMLVNGHTYTARHRRGCRLPRSSRLSPPGGCADPQDAVTVLINCQDNIITQARQISGLTPVVCTGPAPGPAGGNRAPQGIRPLLVVGEAAGNIIDLRPRWV